MDQTISRLLTASADDVAAALKPGLTPREAMSRAALVHDGHTNVAALAAANPYAAGGNLIADLASSFDADRERRPRDPAATARVAHVQARPQLQRAANQLLADNPGLITRHPAGLNFEPGLPSAPLLGLATPHDFPGPVIDVPAGWATLPTGVLDPIEKTDVSAAAAATIPAVTLDVHTGAHAVNVSRQQLDLTDDLAMADVQALVETVTNLKLEAALVAELLAAAGTAATDIDAAEGAVGAAWGTAVDTIVLNPADAPALRRAYAPQAVPFTNVVVTGSIAAGTALIFPRAAVWLLASQIWYASQPEPRILGVQLGASRYGAAGPRRPGVIAAVTLP